MTLTFLGTGTSQGVPVICCKCEVCLSKDPHDTRLRTSVCIEDNQTNVVIDTGPDFRQQILRENITTLDAVIFTHEHKDHTAGLDDIRSFNHITHKKMPVFLRKNVLKQIKREFAYIFQKKKYPGIPSIETHIIDSEPFYVHNILFSPIQVKHHKLDVLGFRIKDLTYITDVNFIADAEKEKIKGTKTLILSALQKEPHISHFTLDEAIALSQEINPEKTYLTHISHKLGTDKEISTQLPPNVHLAYDGLKITF
ncbi:MAG: MBL fold metallo-hydrolase [Chitinophagaceae bacterium]|nr:MBL fold metallo-hydrolase [Chitinophagaceae bacterium]